MEEYEVSLKDYINVVRKERILIASIFLVAVVSAGALSLSLPKQYETKTTLLIMPSISEELGEKAKNPQEEGTAFLATPTFTTETYERLAVTNDILLGIIESLGLESDGKTLSVEALRRRMEPKAEFTKKGGAALPLLTMTVKGNKPEEIKRIAEEWGRLFVEKNSELLSTRTAQSYDFLSERYNEVSEELRNKEEARRIYLEKNPIEALSVELGVLKSAYNGYSSLLHEKRRALNENEAKLKNIEKELAGKSKPLDVDKSTLTLIALQNKVYLSVEDFLTDAKVTVGVLKEEVPYLESETQKLKEEIDKKEAEINEINTHLLRLDRETSTLKDTYGFLSEKVQEARIAKEEQLNSIRIVESPIAPQVPSGPSKKINVAIAGVLGLFVGVFAAFFKNYMDESERKNQRFSGSQEL